ncbi:MAG: leucine-rich repeat protein [Ruminococcus sp.]|nr:leucine-rich repeat protein [Ruminococcus sp.]
MERPQPEYYTEEIEQATDVYAEFVIGIIEEMKRNGAEPLSLVEEKLDYSHIAPSGFGTGDMIVIGRDEQGRGLLHIVDYKNGKGVFVDADHNPQMMLYALGALRAYDGMLDNRGKPKYYFSVEEVNVDFADGDEFYDDFSEKVTYEDTSGGSQLMPDENSTSSWQPEKFLMTGKLGGTAIVDYQAAYNNYYKYRSLLLKKTVTNAAGTDLNGFAYHFRLTAENGAAKQYEPVVQDPEHEIRWQLWLTDENGDTSEQAKWADTDIVIEGGLDENGEFVVPMCGVADSGYVVKLTNVPANRTLKVEEILDDRTEMDPAADKIAGVDYDHESNTVTFNAGEVYEKSFTLAVTDMFKAVKDSEKTSISLDGNVTDKSVNLINDYQRRDLSLEKIIASDRKPDGSLRFRVQVWSKAEFDGSADSNAPETAMTRPAEVASDYRYYREIELQSGQRVTLEKIGTVGDTFYIYEVPDTEDSTKSGGFTILSQNPQRVVLTDTESVAAVDVINGDPGKIIIKKQYTGAYSVLDDDIQALFDDEKVTLELSFEGSEAEEFKNTDLSDLTLLDKNGDKITEFDCTLKAGDNRTIVVRMTSQDTLIVDAAKLRTAAGIADEQPVTVRETNYTGSIRSGSSFYTVTPEETQLTADSVRTIVKNRVSMYSSYIYKRIAGNFAPNMSELYGRTFTMQLTNANGEPAEGVGYIVEFHEDDPDYTSDKDETLSTRAFLDMNSQGVTGSDGRVTVTIPDNAERWEERLENGDKAAEYYFKVYFDRNVRINPAGTSDALSVSELESENDAAFGNLVGYETWYSDILDYDKLNKGMQWQKNADTFVNSTDTTPVRLTKKVHPADGEELTENERDMVFTFTVRDIVNSNAQPVAGISYNVYDEDGSLVSRGNTTDELGQLQLRHGQTAVLQLPSYKFWRIDEVEDGEYRLYTNNGELVIDDQSGTVGTGYSLDISTRGDDGTAGYGESLAANQTAVDKNNAQEQGGGYILNSGLSLNKTYGNDVAIRNLALRTNYFTTSWRGQSPNRAGMEFYDLQTQNYDAVADVLSVYKPNYGVIGGGNNSKYPIYTSSGTSEADIQAIWNESGVLIWCSESFYSEHKDETSMPNTMQLYNASNTSIRHYTNTAFDLWVNEEITDSDTLRELTLPSEIRVLHGDNTVTWHKVNGVTKSAAADLDGNDGSNSNADGKFRKTILIAPNNIKAIGRDAFYKSCAGATQGFGFCEINLLGVEYVGERAFYLDGTSNNYTQPIDKITINGKNAYIKKNAFSFLKNVSEIELKGVNYVGVDSFNSATQSNTTNAKLTIDMTGENATIAAYAFNGSYFISSIVISGVHTIGQYAFQNNYHGSISSENKLIIIGDEEESSIGNYAFRYCSRLQKVNVSGIEKIGNNAFDGSNDINNVTISDVQTIENNAFQNCFKLSSGSTIPNQLTITGNAFENSYISTDVFYNCTNLKSVNISNINALKSGTNNGTSRVFRDCPNVETVSLTNVHTIGDFAFQKCTNLSNVTINNVNTIGNFVFENCYKNSNATDNTLTIIGNNSIGSVINQGAFSNCTYLKTVDISSIKTIADGSGSSNSGCVFFHDYNVNTINLNGIETIGNYAFVHSHITYGKIVGAKKIGNFAFEEGFINDAGYHTMYINGENDIEFTYRDFWKSNNLRALILPKGKVTMGEGCICNAVRIVIMQTDSIDDANASTLTFNTGNNGVGSVSPDAYLVYTNLSSADNPPTFGFSHVLYSDTLNQATADEAINAAGGNTAIHPDVIDLLGGTMPTNNSPRPPYQTAPMSELFVAYREHKDDEI